MYSFQVDFQVFHLFKKISKEKGPCMLDETQATAEAAFQQDG